MMTAVVATIAITAMVATAVATKVYDEQLAMPGTSWHGLEMTECWHLRATELVWSLFGIGTRVMEYAVAPSEYEQYVQQPGQPCRWAENSMLNLQSTDGYSSYLFYERGYLSVGRRSYEARRTKKLRYSTNLCSFGGIPALVGESKPEKERERGRTAPAFGTKLSRGITCAGAA